MPPLLLVYLLPLTQQGQSSIYLAVTLTVLLSKFLFLFFPYVPACHVVAGTHSDARQLVSVASERICVGFVFCSDRVKED